MELLIVIIMIVLGGGIALAIALVAGAVSTAEREREARTRQSAPDRETIAASLVYHIGALGGNDPSRLLDFLREEGRLSAQIRPNVHVSSWADGFRRMSTPEQRAELLDLAVRAAVSMNSAIPLAQYNALLDLSFGLGFQTDALARLRARYRFEYTDYAKAARPQSADRSGGGAPLFERSAADPEPLLKVLGLSGEVSRQQLTSTYRKLAAQNHPDRFHGATAAEQESAAARFIAITEAYEKLIARTP